MRKWISKLAVAFLLCGSLNAAIPNAMLNYDLGLGYRRDHLTLPDFKWTDLSSFELKGTFTMVACNYLYFKAYGDYGWIMSGKRDTFDFENRRVKSGYVFDYSAGGGWRFPFCDEQILICPLFGYSYHQQTLPIRSGNSHHYHAQWDGPWGGVDLGFQLTCDWLVFGGYEYHWNTQYHGKGRMGSFRPQHLKHRGRGYGAISTIGTTYALCYEWIVGVSANYQTFRTRHREHHCHPERRLDGRVRWHSYDLLAHLDYRY